MTRLRAITGSEHRIEAGKLPIDDRPERTNCMPWFAFLDFPLLKIAKRAATRHLEAGACIRGVRRCADGLEAALYSNSVLSPQLR